MHHVRRFSLVLAPLCFAACATEADPVVDDGDLRMGVVGQDGNGLFYRLRDATFEIDGPESVSISTEDGPTVDALEVELAAGSYSVLLDDGWRLERFDPITDATLDVEAMLVSDNPAAALVTGSESSGVVFVFQVADAGPVVLGDGDLEIDIDVDVGVTPTSCDPLIQDCGAGQGCYPSGDAYICANAGDVSLYGDCDFINSCIAGQTCISATANFNCNPGAVGCCVPFCSVSFPTCDASEACFSLGIGDPDVGLCATL